MEDQGSSVAASRPSGSASMSGARILAWSLLMGIVGAVIGGLVGYFVVPTRYECTGLIRIKPVISPNSRTPENALLPSFDAFVRTQAALIQSQRVIDVAMQSEEWKALHRPHDDKALERFMQQLDVSAGSELIAVRFVDRDPKAATAAVKAVITAYNTIYVEGEIQSEGKRRQVLEDRRLTLSNELKLKRDAILQAARESGMDDLRGVYTLKLQNLSRLEAALAEVDLALAAAGKAPQGDTGESQAATRPASADLPMEDLLKRQARCKELVEGAKGEVATVGRRMLDLEKLRREEADILARLEQANRRIDDMRFEFPLLARISIVSDTSQPRAIKDGLRSAVVDAAAGFILCFVATFLLLLFRASTCRAPRMPL